MALFVRAYYLSFHISLIKHWMFLAYKFCALCSFFSVFTLSTPDPIDNSSAIASYDFKNTVNQAEDEGEDDCEVPGELSRLLQQEERAIQ